MIRRARDEVDRAARERYAARIRAWREQTGMTLRQFARLAGTSASRLSDYERAKISPTSELLGRIERVAEVHAPAGTSSDGRRRAGRRGSPGRS